MPCLALVYPPFLNHFFGFPLSFGPFSNYSISDQRLGSQQSLSLSQRSLPPAPTQISRPPPDDPMGRPDQIDSTISRSCGAQAEFHFDLLLGPLWPGHGLHANACYRLISGRGTQFGCSCSTVYLYYLVGGGRSRDIQSLYISWIR